MRFFRLIDDLEIRNRWHLGDIFYGEADQKVALDGRQPLDFSDYLEVTVTNLGSPLYFSLTAFGVPVVANPLAATIAGISGSGVQIIPSRISGKFDHSVMHCLARVECVDEVNSEFTKWSASDHRSDLAGQYRSISELVLKIELIPPESHIFRILRWEVGLIVSEYLLQNMQGSGCHGAKFIPIRTS